MALVAGAYGIKTSVRSAALPPPDQGDAALRALRGPDAWLRCACGDRAAGTPGFSVGALLPEPELVRGRGSDVRAIHQIRLPARQEGGVDGWGSGRATGVPGGEGQRGAGPARAHSICGSSARRRRRSSSSRPTIPNWPVSVDGKDAPSFRWHGGPAWGSDAPKAWRRLVLNSSGIPPGRCGHRAEDREQRELPIPGHGREPPSSRTARRESAPEAAYRRVFGSQRRRVRPAGLIPWLT